VGTRLRAAKRRLHRRWPWHQANRPEVVPRSTLWPRVYDILVKELKVPGVSVAPSARFAEDLGFDSLEAIELLIVVEEAFHLEIPDEDTESLKTVADLLLYLEERITHGQHPAGG